MTADYGSSRPRRARSATLVAAIALLGLVWIIGIQAPVRNSLPRWMIDAHGWAQLVANFAIAVIGLRTPQRNAWLIYLGVSVVALVAVGATPFAALWFLPVLLKTF